MVVTGVGMVTPVGLTAPESWDALRAGISGAGPITKFDTTRQQVRIACEVKGFDPASYIDRKEARRYDLFAQYAIAAAHQAVVQARLDVDVPDRNRVGVVIGSGIGGMHRRRNKRMGL